MVELQGIAPRSPDQKSGASLFKLQFQQYIYITYYKSILLKNT